MIATAFVQNGAKVYIASRKEKQLKEVCLCGSQSSRHTANEKLTRASDYSR